MRPSAWLTPLAIATVATTLAIAAAPAGAQLAAVCPATFEVLHDDRIGTVSFPAGAYQVTVRGGLSCRAASNLFAEFLEDFDGALPRPWTLDPATATFTRGAGPVSFSLVLQATPSGGGGGHHPSGGDRCPGTFRVMHDDRIGSLRLRSGLYRITLLSTHGIGCARAATLFARFLEDYDGVLPRPWALDPSTGTFRRGAGRVGFRVKPYDGVPSNGGGGGVHPRSGSRCPGTFRVLHNDRIGRLRLARGRYTITLLKGRGIACSQASAKLTEFLDDYAGVLPRPWVLRVQSATFVRGSSGVGFRIKPVGAARR